MRKTRDERARITFRLPAEEKLEAERNARRNDQRLSSYVRQALVEKAARDRAGEAT
jgi:hypothetical protein